MDLILTDRTIQPDGCFGVMRQPDGAYVCDTLEHAYPDGANGWTVKIPPGTYRVTRYLSPARGYQVWLLHDVPGHTAIEIHKGNWNADSDGCILVGLGRAPSETGQMITKSGLAWVYLMGLQGGCDEWQLAVQ